ncbi:conserved hypothetical protein [Histoplasma capsulatum G186AR]|uniref:Alpha-L-rhamnosidase C n=1 Tax=Ajellomyces capsulatus (strain G186AR / H82 / ATCC MYA-2454 / RMSCC 2432) TaxID=447093 RepID=C0NMN9_AJECG|nr:uncharacterized protein HCBG_04016 [Histoplasma capsulatum G186AR]EEH07137.1 conserved hypothetical protein [Histoplasma capsulatum G186AR]
MEPLPSVEEGNGSSPPSPVAAQLPPAPPTNKHPPPSTRSDRASKPSGTSPAASSRLRSASLIFLESNPPSGMWMATGDIASRAPTLNEIRAGCFSADGWTEEGQIQRFKLSRANTSVPRVAITKSNALQEQEQTAHLRRSNTAPPWNSGNDTITITGGKYMKQGDDYISRQSTERPPTLSVKSAIDTKSAQAASPARIPDETGTYPNGYHFPPKHTWSQATIIGLKAFGRFVITPFGLLVTIYGLNIVAWGAMIFFLLLNAAPALCNPSCSASNSARKIWIEIDSQILNALFCVTGFGLIPWRFRDFYYLLQWRAMNRHDALRKLAGVHRSWFRLPGSDQLPANIGPPPVTSPSHRNNNSGSDSGNGNNSNDNHNNNNNNNNNNTNTADTYTEEQLGQFLQNPSLPLPLSSIAAAPLTGVRARPTKPFLLDIVVWMYVLNTALQACLAGIMWGLDRFTRPGWAVGLLIAAGSVTGMVAGGVAFWEGRRVKMVEGIPVEEADGEGEGEGRRTGEKAAEEGLGLGLDRKRTKSWRKAKWYRRL